MPKGPRTPTAIDALAEHWVDVAADLSPIEATYIGRMEHNHRFGDYSPGGTDRAATAASSTRRQLTGLHPVDAIDEVTKLDLMRELTLQGEAHEARTHLHDLNVIASPAQDVRAVFDLMPTDTVTDWSTIAARLSAIPDALRGYEETLRLGIATGSTPAERQVREVGAQIDRYVGDDGFFATFVDSASSQEGALPRSLHNDLARGSEAARAAYANLARFLRTELFSRARERDAVGRDEYALHSARFLGAQVDLDETYDWGVQELRRMVDEQNTVAQQILPGASPLEAIAHLDADLSRKLHGTEHLQRWMQETSDRAVAELGASHFDIPAAVRTLECRIAPTQEGGIYYTGPTDDFSRPGRMWWSVPEGVTEFDTWRELTTVYHEGVPGHHLQIGQAVHNRSQLNAWRRLMAGTSGHAEGWALYAERLMEQLGYLDDPADRLGMLDAQRMRAARVVLDIGVHLQKPRLDGTGVWDADYALEFMRANVNMPDEFIVFEVNRYLGWPGQAPSYKIGQRIWEQIRDDVATRRGADFSMKQFHKEALDIGGVGLDSLRAALTPHTV